MTEPIEGEVIEAEGMELEPASDRNLLGVTDPVAVIAEAKRIAGAMKDDVPRQQHDPADRRERSHQAPGPADGRGDDRGRRRRRVDPAAGERLGGARGGAAHDRRARGRRRRGDVHPGRAQLGAARRLRAALDGADQGDEPRARAPLGFLLALTGADATAPEELDSDSTPIVVPPTVLPGWAKPVADVGPAARTLVAILKAGGVERPADRTVEIGKRVRDRCDGTFPSCVLAVLADVRELIVPADSAEAA